MSLEPENIQREIEEALNALAESKGEEIARQVKPILLANLDRGRLQTFADGDPARVPAYVWLIAQTFASLNPYLHQLQTERNSTTWEPLIERMGTWAYNFFLRKGFTANDHTREIAIECANDAAVNLLKAHFPYDTAFDPWAHIIVQNACRKHIDKAFRKSAVPEDKKVELEDGLADPHDTLLEIDVLQKEAGRELFEALNQLSPARRSVIQSIYFEEMEPEEIAKKLGKSVGAVYSLQFNALKDLRKILSTIRDNLNE